MKNTCIELLGGVPKEELIICENELSRFAVENNKLRVELGRAKREISLLKIAKAVRVGSDIDVLQNEISELKKELSQCKKDMRKQALALKGLTVGHVHWEPR